MAFASFVNRFCGILTSFSWVRIGKVETLDRLLADILQTRDTRTARSRERRPVCLVWRKSTANDRQSLWPIAGRFTSHMRPIISRFTSHIRPIMVRFTCVIIYHFRCLVFILSTWLKTNFTTWNIAKNKLLNIYNYTHIHGVYENKLQIEYCMDPCVYITSQTCQVWKAHNE